MYCSSCRQERLGGQFCAACGKRMASRSREVLEQELAHIQFLLEDMLLWDNSSVPRAARNYLVQRYERQTRILSTLLAEDAPLPEAAALVETVAPVEVPTPIVLAEQAERPAEPAPLLLAPPPPANVIEALEKNPFIADMQAPRPVTPATSRLSFSMTAGVDEAEDEEEREDEAPALAPVVTEPLFDVPVRRTPTVRLVEEVSTWDRVWRPFLYESIGWFIGAFLIVAGSLYLAFDSWAGLTSLTRSLVVFGMIAGYSTAFSLCGAWLARREALAGAGRILGLIGAAVGPFAGLALGPVEGLGEGIPLYLLLPLLLGWSVGVSRLVRKPAESFDEPSRPLLQTALVGTTWMMGLAPLVARLGTAALWGDLLPCALFAALARLSLPAPRTTRALTFALAAPAYLSLLYGVRLHVAIASSGEPLSAGGYAPFLAFLLVTALRFRERPPEQAADSLSVGVASLLMGTLLLSATGPAPALVVTAATFTWTMITLSRGSALRVRWLYPAYAGAYVVYTVADQLLPEALRPGEAWPARSLTALPFVIAGTLLAGWLEARAARTSTARGSASAEVLLRCTALAAPALALLGHLSGDFRPAFWSTLGVMALCLAAGRRLERFYLSAVGAALSVFPPAASWSLWGSTGASLVCGVGALAFAALPLVSVPRVRNAFHAAAGWLALSGFVSALVAGAHGGALVGLALSGAAMLLVAWTIANPSLFAVAVCGAAAVVPRLASLAGVEWVPLALAVTAVGLSLLGGRGGRARRLGAAGVAYALLAFCAGWELGVSWFGVIILLAAAAVGVASRTLPGVRPLAVLLAAFALLPRVGSFTAWPWMTPGLSVGLFILWALGGSVVAARRGREASTVLAGVLALLFPVIPVIATAAEPGPGTGELVVLLALAALCTARALHPAVSVGLAAVGPLLYVVDPVHVPLALGGAVLFSALALLESHPTVFRLLAGERRFAPVATLGALAFLLVACLRTHAVASAFVLAGATLLPLVWTRANRQPFLAAIAPLLVFLCAYVTRDLSDVAELLPLLALAVVRAAEHLPSARRLLLGTAEEAPVRRLSSSMQGALAGVAMAVTVTVLSEGKPPPLMLAMLVVSLVLQPGDRPSWRVGLGVGLLLFCAPLHPVGILLLLALGLLTHHAPAATRAFFRASPDELLRPLSVVGALVLAVGSMLLGEPSPGAFFVLAGVLAVGAFLLSRAWMLTASVLVLAFASLGRTQAHAFLSWRPASALAFAGVALGAALFSALCQVGGVQRALVRGARRLSPGLGSTWSEPLWVAGALALGGPVSWHLASAGLGGLPLGVAVLGGLAAGVLMVTRERMMAHMAVALLALVLMAAVPPLWSPAVLSLTGLVLCGVGTWLDGRELPVGAALHHAGWVLSFASVVGLRDLRHPGMVICVLGTLGAAWAVVYRRRERETVGWAVTWLVSHALALHVQSVQSALFGTRRLVLAFGVLSALLAVAVRLKAGARVRESLARGFSWVGLLEASAALLAQLLLAGLGKMSPGGAGVAGLLALGLMVTRERKRAVAAVALLAAVSLAAVAPAWSPAVLSGTGLVLCLVGTWLEARELSVGAALHHAGGVLSLVSVFGLGLANSPGTAACLVLGLGSAWAVVYRRRERERVGWVATGVVAHALLAQGAVLLSTGRGPALILPVFGALSALLATLALGVAGEPVRRRVGHGFTGLALGEVLLSLVFVSSGTVGARGASLLACAGLAVLVLALVRRAVREEAEDSAFLAQGALVLGYLSVRLHALGAQLGGADSLVGLVGGAVFSGLYVLAQREGSGLPAFRRPALWGAFLFPMAGLLTAPWHHPLSVAALLVGYAAHFAALAAHPSQRGVGSLVSAVAFNAALFLVWLGTGAGEPQYYVLPVGLSLLVLLRVFRDALEPATQAKWRAFAITFIYVAGAWKPLLFQDGQAMVLCVLVCVVGVVAGVVLRIRSYVYLGTAFMVTCVVANLARFGMRDHRTGAVLLSLLGLGVVGFMVLVTAQRAELMERYARVRALMDTWEG